MMSKILTRLFDNFPDAQHAVIELERVGVPHGDISLVAHRSHESHVAGAHVREPRSFTTGEASARDAGIGGAAGGVIGAAGGALAGLGLMAIPGLGPVVAAGWLASTAVGAVVGGAVGGAAGGIIGALTNAGVSEEEAHVYAEGVRRGGTLVSAKVEDDRLAEAQSVLNATPYVDIAARGAAYRESGWARFDETARPYTDDEIEQERRRYPPVENRPLP
jgi:hypothetical protein